MTFNEFQEKALSTANYSVGNKIIYPALGLCGESGEVAEKIKKTIRDKEGKFTPEISLEIAKELIKLAKECGAKYAKFQKRNNKELLSFEQYNSPHPESSNSFGKTYGEHREYLEFSIEQRTCIKPAV